jgi:hypothetical protein
VLCLNNRDDREGQPKQSGNDRDNSCIHPSLDLIGILPPFSETPGDGTNFKSAPPRLLRHVKVETKSYYRRLGAPQKFNVRQHRRRLPSI